MDALTFSCGVMWKQMKAIATRIRSIGSTVIGAVATDQITLKIGTAAAFFLKTVRACQSSIDAQNSCYLHFSMIFLRIVSRGMFLRLGFGTCCFKDLAEVPYVAESVVQRRWSDANHIRLALIDDHAVCF